MIFDKFQYVIGLSIDDFPNWIRGNKVTIHLARYPIPEHCAVCSMKERIVTKNIKLVTCFKCLAKVRK